MADGRVPFRIGERFKFLHNTGKQPLWRSLPSTNLNSAGATVSFECIYSQLSTFSYLRLELRLLYLTLTSEPQ